MRQPELLKLLQIEWPPRCITDLLFLSEPCGKDMLVRHVMGSGIVGFAARAKLVRLVSILGWNDTRRSRMVQCSGYLAGE